MTLMMCFVGKLAISLAKLESGLRWTSDCELLFLAKVLSVDLDDLFPSGLDLKKLGPQFRKSLANSTRPPGHVASAENVDVQVRHVLAAARAVFDDEPVAAFQIQLLRHFGGL